MPPQELSIRRVHSWQSDSESVRISSEREPVSTTIGDDHDTIVRCTCQSVRPEAGSSAQQASVRALVVLHDQAAVVHDQR